MLVLLNFKRLFAGYSHDLRVHDGDHDEDHGNENKEKEHNPDKIHHFLIRESVYLLSKCNEM
jgi:hypothetical protein